MDATSGLNKKTPGPGTAASGGLVLSPGGAKLGLGRARPISPFAAPPDAIASSADWVRSRMALAFAEIPTPTLSATGANAGLDPPSQGAANDGVTTTPTPALNRPIASRAGDDISIPTQEARARALGLQQPPRAPMLSATGAKAGLSPISPVSSRKGARSAATVAALARSVSELRTNARALLTQPVPDLGLHSDKSARSGVSGSAPIPAAGRGFTMRVAKTPVAQDRERWASGTQARLAGAMKGVGVPTPRVGDHLTASKPQMKRSWVGVQGDATEGSDSCSACSDLSRSNYAAVSKAPPVRQLEKERVPSDVCPPLMSGGTLEVMLQRDAHLAATAPAELLRTWAGRPAMLRGGRNTASTSVSFRPPITAKKGIGAGGDCCASTCGCSGGTKNGNAAYRGASSRTPGASRAGTVSSGARSSGGEEIAPLLESFAVRHGKDANAEWFVAVFRRGARLVLGVEQRGPTSDAWRPNPKLGMKASDLLVATLHTHSRNVAFSTNDRTSANALGVPMVLVTPGAERARVYDPATRSIRDVPVLHTKGWRTAWQAITWSAKSIRNADSGFGSITISQPPQATARAGNARYVPVASRGEAVFGSQTWTGARTQQSRVLPGTALPAHKLIDARPPIIDEAILARLVELAADNPGDDVSPELVWLTLAAEWKDKPAPKVIPDPDLVRAIVAVAQRKGKEYRDAPDLILELAKQEPLWVEPTLLNSIINYSNGWELDPTLIWDFTEKAQLDNSAQLKHLRVAFRVWDKAWNDRLTLPGPMPTPPDIDLFLAIRAWATRLKGSKSILRAAHAELDPKKLLLNETWPQPRQMSPDQVQWFLWVVLQEFGDTVWSASNRSALELLGRIGEKKSIPFDIRNRAWAELLAQELDQQYVAQVAGMNHVGNKLLSGQRMSRGEFRTSPNGRTILILLEDGNLVIFDRGVKAPEYPDGRALRAWGGSANRLDMQTDGNLVLSTLSPELQQVDSFWSSNTDELDVTPAGGNVRIFESEAGAYLEVLDDGRVVIYAKDTLSSKGVELWDSGTGGFQLYPPPSSSSSACDVPFINMLCAAYDMTIGRALDLWSQVKGDIASTVLHPSLQWAQVAPGGFSGPVVKIFGGYNADWANSLKFPRKTGPAAPTAAHGVNVAANEYGGYATDAGEAFTFPPVGTTTVEWWYDSDFWSMQLGLPPGAYPSPPGSGVRIGSPTGPGAPTGAVGNPNAQGVPRGMAGHLFNYPEEAALNALSDYLAISQSVNKELGGAIYQIGDHFFYTDAFEGISNKMKDLPDEINAEVKSLGKGVSHVAWWHVHPSKPGEKPGDLPSEGDRAVSIDLGRGYVAGPTGVAKSFLGQDPAVDVGPLWQTHTVGVEYDSPFGPRVKAE